MRKRSIVAPLGLVVLVGLALLRASQVAVAQGKKAPPTYYVITDSSLTPQQIGIAVDLVPTAKVLAAFMDRDVAPSINRNGILSDGDPIYYLGGCSGTPAVWIDTTTLGWGCRSGLGPLTCLRPSA